MKRCAAVLETVDVEMTKSQAALLARMAKKEGVTDEELLGRILTDFARKTLGKGSGVAHGSQ